MRSVETLSSGLHPSAGALIARVRALPAAAELLRRLGDAPDVHLIGGAARDILIGAEPGDLDLLVEGGAVTIARRLGGELRVHDRFGTATVRVGGFCYDIAAARREAYARAGALPEVAPASLEQDLLRRDFSVNAIAIRLSGPRAGELSTAPRALEDLRARRLQVLHDRSFSDDPTRLLRLIRYASRLRFEIEPHTLALARTAVADRALDTVSALRVGAELRLLVRELDPVAGLEQMSALGLDAEIHPGFGLSDPALARRSLGLLPAEGRPDVLVLALCVRAIESAELASLLNRLAFGAIERDAIIRVATGAGKLAQSLAGAELPSEIAGAVSGAGAGPEAVAIAGALGPAQAARDWLTRLAHVRLEISGADLLAAGIEQGPAVGRALSAALDAKLDGRADGREAELDRALRAARAS